MMTKKLWIPAVLVFVASTAWGCSVPNETRKTKRLLESYGTIEGEWELRDEAAKKTYTYVLLKNETGRIETHEIVATDGERKVVREQAGGIDSTGCFLYGEGTTSYWIQQLPPEALEGAETSGDRTRTMCLEYKDTPGWTFIPAAARKAAEPPPPPTPPPAVPGADAGTPDGGAGTPDDVPSALPQ